MEVFKLQVLGKLFFTHWKNAYTMESRKFDDFIHNIEISIK